MRREKELVRGRNLKEQRKNADEGIKENEKEKQQ